MPDYSALIDEQTWAFIAATNAAYPENAVSDTPEGQRHAYDTMCRAFYAGRPPGLPVTDTRAGRVPLRVYGPENSLATILFAHGGGFVVGGLDSHDDVCAEISAATGYRLVSVDYRLAPENPHPASFEDCREALEWLRAQGSGPIVLMGDSAGGNLMAALAHANRNAPDIAGQVLIYPGLGFDRNEGSYLTHAQAPMLTRAEIEYYMAVRTGGQRPADDDPTLAPLQDTDFSGLPPTVAFAAECDPLCDDAPLYCDRIRAAGGQATCIVEPGLVHGYLRARHSVARAADSFRRIVKAARQLGAGRKVDLVTGSTGPAAGPSQPDIVSQG